LISTHTPETTLQKIRKLLALADGNENENEREVAMQFAMDLLAKHNLTVSEVQQAEFDQHTGEYTGSIRLERWTRDVVNAACTLYYTDFYIRDIYTAKGTFRTVPVFIGTEENVAVTMEVATWLVNSIRLESNALYSDAYERRSFRQGAACRVLERAIAMVEAEKRQGQSTGTSLMVVRNSLESANQKYLERLDLRYTSPRSSYIDGAAFAQGQNFGDHVGLAKRAQGQIGKS
jgi:hypothetical protein